jgi:threonine aldolase
VARARELALHLDGARIWNAAVATGQLPAALAAPADSVSACFSKGLGAPVGSVIAGPATLRVRAHRFRKMLGGGMRQAGVIAAAALYALEHHRERLAEDHANARRLAEGIANITHLACDASQVDTNIVMFSVATMSAQDLAMRLDAAGVRMNPVGPRELRAVTHMDVATADIERALSAIARCVART